MYQHEQKCVQYLFNVNHTHTHKVVFFLFALVSCELWLPECACHEIVLKFASGELLAQSPTSSVVDDAQHSQPILKTF